MSPVPTHILTGKRNMWASLVAWLKTVLPDVTFVEAQYHQAQVYPCIAMVDAGLFGLGETAFNRNLGNNQRGRIEQTQIEFNCMDLLADGNEGAEINARILRDRLKQALEGAGDQYPACEIRDYSAPLLPLTGAFLWHPSDVSAAWNEAYIANDSVQPGVKRYRIFARIYWHELADPPAT